MLASPTFGAVVDVWTDPTPAVLTGETTWTLQNDVAAAGVISGDGSLRVESNVEGGSTLTINALNTFSGGLTIGSGATYKVIKATANGSGDNSGIGSEYNPITVESGGKLWFTDAVRSAGYHAANVTVNSGGTVQLDVGDGNFATGSTTTMYGTAAITGSGLWRFRNAGVNLVVGGQEGVNANATISVPMELRDLTNNTTTFHIVNSDDVLTVSSVVKQASGQSNILLKTGDGKLVLTGANTFNGGLVVQEGTVHLNKTNNCLSASCPITVGSTEGEEAKLILAQKALGDHTGTVKIYKGGTIQISGIDISIGNGKGIEFIGGGTVSASSGYFWVRKDSGGANPSLTVTGENATATISSPMYWHSAVATIDVQEATSSLSISGSMTQYSGTSSSATKIGDGKLTLTAATRFSFFNIDEGTVEVTSDGTLGTGAVTVGSGGILLWNRSNAALGNSLQGTGLLQIRRNTTGNYEPGDVMQSDFAGTIELLDNTRYRSHKNNFSTTLNQTTIKVNPTTEFWANATADYYTKFDLSGDGAGTYDRTARGAIRIDGGNSAFHGDVFLSGNALLGSAAQVTGTFNGTIDTKGHTLTLGVTVTAGGTLKFAGDIGSTAETDGSLVVRNDNFSAIFGDSTAAPEDAPTTNTIAVPITNNNTTNTASRGLRFDVGANRTLEVTAAITENGFTKQGDGTLRLTNMPENYGQGFTIAAGTVEWTKSATLTQVISGNGTLKISGSGTTVGLTATNTFKNLFVDTGSTVEVTSPGNLGASDVALQGAGTVRVTTSSNFEPGAANYSNFTGTFELAGSARFKSTHDNFSTTRNAATIRVNSGAQFWAYLPDSATGTTPRNYYAKLDIAGDGAGAGGDSAGRGAIRVDGWAPNNFYGDVSLSADARIEATSSTTGTFYGTIDTKGFTLTTGQSVNTGGTLVFAGDVISSAETLGSLVVNSGTYTVKIGDTSDSATAVTQTIGVPVDYNIMTSDTSLEFASGANRTIHITQDVSANAVTIKSGATVRLSGAGAFTTLALGVEEGAQLIVDNATTLPMTSIITGKISGVGTITPQGTAGLSVANTGVLSPGHGDTLGTLTVGGNLTMAHVTDPGTIEIYVRNRADELPLNSVLDVTGTADLTGATIHLVKAADAQDIQLLDSFDLVLANDFSANVLESILLTDDLTFGYDNPSWLLSIVALEGGREALRVTAVDGNVVPEPATWALLALGMVCLAYRRFRR